MDDDIVDEELSIVYEEPRRPGVLDSNAFRQPLTTLKLRAAVTVDLGQTVLEALAIMRLKRFGCVLVTSGPALSGILTERDVITKVLGGQHDLAELRVEQVMTPNPECLSEDDTIAHALNAMHVGGYRHIPIVDRQNRPVAVVSIKDVIGFIAESFPDDILNLPPHPPRHPDEREGA